MELIEITPDETKMLEEAAGYIETALEQKENPSALRLTLVELQALRFQIGRSHVIYAARARDAVRTAYNENKALKMSPNAASKEAEMSDKVVMYKNARDFMENAKDTISSFVNINQTSLGIAKEEAKNNV